jgi:predicted aminopeptidase
MQVLNCAIRNLFLAGAVLLLASCEQAAYLQQAAEGQLDILASQQPVDEVLANRKLKEGPRKRLELSKEVLAFAENELALSVDGRYQNFVDLKRPAVVWNVFASEELALTPKTWCYPIVGCVAYRGFFDKATAAANMHKLRKEGYDTFFGGVSAYPTLGYFRDPILSTFLNMDEGAYIALFFHELAHSVVYVENDSAFNESFATAVEREGLRRWDKAHGGSKLLAKSRQRQKAHRKFVAFVQKYQKRLRTLYASNVSDDTKRSKKTAVFKAMRNDYKRNKSRFKPNSYDHWFKNLNNAKIVSIGTYNDLVPAFTKMIRSRGGDMNAFYSDVKVLAKLSKSERVAKLKAL